MLFYLALLGLVLLIGVGTFEIVSRYFFNYSFTGSHEISLLLVSWVIFLGFGKVVAENQDIAITFLIDRVNVKYRKLINIFNHVLLLVTSIYMTNATIELIIQQIPKKSLILEISKALYTLPLAIVLIVITFQTIINIINDFATLESNRKEG